MLVPKLKLGDTIAVFSPSSPATVTAAARYHRGKAFLEGRCTGKRDFYRSGSIAGVRRAGSSAEI